MAYYADDGRSAVAASGTLDLNHWTGEYQPSDEVPVSGIYFCKACKEEVESNKGDKFPPQNHHQH